MYDYIDIFLYRDGSLLSFMKLSLTIYRIFTGEYFFIIAFISYFIIFYGIFISSGVSCIWDMLWIVIGYIMVMRYSWYANCEFVIDDI